MPRKYIKRDDQDHKKFCACGCGMELTAEQIRIGQVYASRACSYNIKRKTGSVQDKFIACKCGCGENVPSKNRYKQYYFVNQKHELLYIKQEMRRQEEERYQLRSSQQLFYCSKYDPESTFCVSCYDSTAARFRGCYGKPKRAI